MNSLKNRTGLIVLGASVFPKSHYSSEPAFSQAKERLLSYFEDPKGMSLRQDDILDLFNSELNMDNMDEEISSFIQRRKADGLQSLLIYYVGHGGFTSHTESFFLATYSTRDNNPEVSSITFRTLSTTISQFTYDIRTIFILDCCFAASASKEFMAGDINETIKRQFKEDFPSRGIALLCSSSKDAPSLIVRERNITMFSEALEIALRKGNPLIKSKFLTLRQIHQTTYFYIKEFNAESAIRPEVLSPFQPVGDVADFPIFINNGYIAQSSATDTHTYILLKRDFHPRRRHKFLWGLLIFDDEWRYDLPFNVYLDSEHVGDIINGGELNIKTEPGIHHIRVYARMDYSIRGISTYRTIGSDEQKITVNQGKNVLLFMYKPGHVDKIWSDRKGVYFLTLASV